jgi:arylsulfatase A-like enzyme
MLDDLGKEWISGFGASEIKTPAIDKLISTGISFKNVYSMPQCTPTRVTLLTGQYPWRHGWVNHFDVPRWGHGVRFDPNLNPSFPKMLRNAGYSTCAAGKWQINDFRLEPDAMVKAGFDEYCMWTGGEGGNIKLSENRYWDPYIHTKSGSKVYKNKFGEDVFTDFIIDFMKKNKDKPMMIYYPMCLPHGPLTSTPLEPNAPKSEQHKSMVRYADHILNVLVKALDQIGIRENTIIIWTTDNGTSGSIIGDLNGKSVKGGKSMLSENGVNAPFIINAPGIVPEGITSDALIDFSDLLPTLCDLAQTSPDKKYEYDGISFAPQIYGIENKSKRDWIMALGSNPAKIENGRIKNAFDFRDRVVRDKNFKAYIDTLNKIYEIIELKSDFYEENNLLNSKREDVISGIKKFESVIKKYPSSDASPIYTKSKNSFFDIDSIKLLKMSNRGKLKPNKTRAPLK